MSAKRSKSLIVLQTVPMLLQLLFMAAIPFCSFSTFMELTSDMDFSGTMILMAVLIFLATISGITAGVVSLVGAIKKNGAPPLFTTALVKIFSLPLYLISGALWVLLAMGMYNPFLIWGIPIEIGIGIGCTFIYMIGTSAPLIIYAIVYSIKYKRKPTVSIVLAVLFLFTLVLDYVGLIIYAIFLKKWFVDKYPPLTEEEKKVRNKSLLITFSIAVFVVIVLAICFLTSSTYASNYLLSDIYTNGISGTHPGTFIDNTETINGYEYKVTYVTDQDTVNSVIDSYNTFTENHPSYRKRIGEVTIIFCSDGEDEIYRISAGNEPIENYPQIVFELEE